MTTGESNPRLAHNTAMLVTIRVVVPLLSVALMVVLSRHLGATGVGRYTLAYGFLYLFNTAAPLGLFAVITRDGARNRADLDRILSNALTLGSVSSAMMCVAMIWLTIVLDYDQDTRQALLVLSIAILPYTIARYFEGASVALGRISHIAFAALAEYGLKVGLGIAALLAGYGLDTVLILAVAGRCLAAIVNGVLLRFAGVHFRWSWDRETVRKLLALAPVFLATAVFAAIHSRIDVVMLSKLRPIADVGYYGAAWRLLEFGKVVPQSLCLAIYPQVAFLLANDPARLALIARTTMRYLMALALPIAAGGTLFASYFLTTIYGPEFSAATWTLSVLLWSLIPFSITRYHAYVLVAAEKQRADLLLNIAIAAVNIALNLILIPRYGHLGAAIATLAALVLYATIQQTYLRNRLPGKAAPLSLPVASLTATTAMTVGAWATLDYSPILAFILAVLIYPAALALCRFFSREELQMIGLDRLAHRFLPGSGTR